MKILLERPPEMSMEEYRILRTFQQKLLKRRKAPMRNIPIPLKPGYNFHPKLF